MEGRKYFLCRNLTSALIFSFVTFVFCISSHVQYNQRNNNNDVSYINNGDDGNNTYTCTCKRRPKSNQTRIIMRFLMMISSIVHVTFNE